MKEKKSRLMKQKSFGTTMGVTSIIAILVILILVVFATLSLVTAQADLRLTEKTEQSVTSYYAADTKAEEIIQQIQATKGNAAKLKATCEKNGVTAGSQGGKSTYAFVVDIDDNRELAVKVSIAGKKVTRDLWQIKPVKEWESDNEITLIQ